MVRTCLTSGLLMLTVCCMGCGESYQPTKREGTAPKSQNEAAPAGEKDVAAAHGTATAPELAALEAHAGAAAPVPTGPDVDTDALHLSAPEKWVRKQPRSSMLIAEFALPKAEGDAQDGRLTVSSAGGSVKDNIDRWRTQFVGKPQKETKDEVELGGVTVTVVDFTGKFSDQAGPFAPGVEREGYRMLGAIIPVKGQLYFVKAYGPEKTMDAQGEAFRAFLKTLQVK